MIKTGQFCIIRTYSAGVFAGIIASRKGKEVLIKNAIRIWYWTGAASLSQLAVEGTKSPTTCKFGLPVSEILVTEAVEILAVSKTAEKNIRSVTPWQQ